MSSATPSETPQSAATTGRQVRRAAGLAALGLAFLMLLGGVALVAAGIAADPAEPLPTIQSSP